MSEPQYAQCFEEPVVTLGAMTGSAYKWDPKRLAWYFSRYKFVAKMLKGSHFVAEVGCGDGFASRIVAVEVGTLDLYDFDKAWVTQVLESGVNTVSTHDITKAPLRRKYNAIYMCDVIEHIKAKDEPALMRNIVASLYPDGAFIAGAPSLESQKYASGPSRIGHVNCRSGERFREDMKRYFSNVFLFSMNDEVVHTGDYRMAHYLFALCCGPKP